MSNQAHRHRCQPPVLPRARDRAQEHIDHRLRIAWLHVHADLMFSVDPTGQTTAALLDLADLLEALDRDGYVAWPCVPGEPCVHDRIAIGAVTW